MRILILLLAAILPMNLSAITPVAHACAGAGGPSTGATSAAASFTGGNLITISVAALAAPSLTDSSGNTYTCLTTHGTNPIEELCYVVNPTVTASQTITASGANTYLSFCYAVWTLPSLPSAGTQNGSTAVGVTTLQTGAVTTTVANQLVLAGVGANGGGTFSIDSSFTVLDSMTFSNLVHYAASLAFVVVPSTASTNPTWTNSASVETSAAIASFLPAVPGASSAVKRRVIN